MNLFLPTYPENVYDHIFDAAEKPKPEQLDLQFIYIRNCLQYYKQFRHLL